MTDDKMFEKQFALSWKDIYRKSLPDVITILQKKQTEIMLQGFTQVLFGYDLDSDDKVEVLLIGRRPETEAAIEAREAEAAALQASIQDGEDQYVIDLLRHRTRDEVLALWEEGRNK